MGFVHIHAVWLTPYIGIPAAAQAAGTEAEGSY